MRRSYSDMGFMQALYTFKDAIDEKYDLDKCEAMKKLACNLHMLKEWKNEKTRLNASRLCRSGFDEAWNILLSIHDGIKNNNNKNGDIKNG